MKTAGRSGWKRWPAAAVLLACTAVSGPVVAEGEGGAAPEAAAQADDPFVFVVWGHPRGLHAGMPALHLDEVVDTAADAVEAILAEGAVAAMNRFNVRSGRGRGSSPQPSDSSQPQ